MKDSIILQNGARHGAFLHILILHRKLGTTLGTGFKVDDVIYENAKDDDDFKMRSRRTVKKSFFSIYLPCHPSANLKKQSTWSTDLLQKHQTRKSNSRGDDGIIIGFPLQVV